MKLRPQFQLRFRDAAQFEAVKAQAERGGVSMNEWILRKVEYGGAKGLAVDDQGGADQRSGNGTSVPVVRKAKGDKKLVHPVQPMRNELGSRDGHLQPSAHEKHQTYVAGNKQYCSDCKVFY